MDTNKHARPTASTFDEVSKSDQRVKLRKRQEIQTNWRSDIQDVIPAQIKPRLNGYRSSKAKIGSVCSEKQWWQWGLDFTYRLERLSSMTAGKLVFAQELMMLEVRNRQQDRTIRSFEAIELLKSDVERIIDDLKGRAIEIDEEDQDDEEAENDEEEVDEDGVAADGQDATNPNAEQQSELHDHDSERNGLAIHGNAEIRASSAMHGKAPKIKVESIEDEIEAISKGLPAPSTSISAKRSELMASAKIATLRGDAMRLRQEASKREAEAFEMEAKVLRAAAREANEVKRERLED